MLFNICPLVGCEFCFRDSSRAYESRGVGVSRRTNPQGSGREKNYPPEETRFLGNFRASLGYPGMRPKKSWDSDRVSTLNAVTRDSGHLRQEVVLMDLSPRMATRPAIGG